MRTPYTEAMRADLIEGVVFPISVMASIICNASSTYPTKLRLSFLLSGNFPRLLSLSVQVKYPASVLHGTNSILYYSIYPPISPNYALKEGRD